MSKISQADKNSMYELAEEIIECKRENDHREAIGIGSDSERICRLYDLSDSMFCAERVKSLLDELKETQAENYRLRNPEPCKHDGATWYDGSGREKCGMCGSDI